MKSRVKKYSKNNSFSLRKKIIFTNRKKGFSFLKFNSLAIDSSLIKSFFIYFLQKGKVLKKNSFFHIFSNLFSLIAKYFLCYDF